MCTTVHVRINDPSSVTPERFAPPGERAEQRSKGPRRARQPSADRFIFWPPPPALAALRPLCVFAQRGRCMPAETHRAKTRERKKKEAAVVGFAVKVSTFTYSRAQIVVKKKSKTGGTVCSRINLVGKRRHTMNYATDKEHRGHLTRQRTAHKVFAVLALVATLGIWVAVAGFATRQAASGGAQHLGRRLLFIPRYSWPTAPPGPAGCLLPFRAFCTTYGTRYPPDIFTAATGSY